MRAAILPLHRMRPGVTTASTTTRTPRGIDHVRRGRSAVAKRTRSTGAATGPAAAARPRIANSLHGPHRFVALTIRLQFTVTVDRSARISGRYEASRRPHLRFSDVPVVLGDDFHADGIAIGKSQLPCQRPIRQHVTGAAVAKL